MHEIPSPAPDPMPTRAPRERTTTPGSRALQPTFSRWGYAPPVARILLVEDEPALAEAVALGLRDEGHVVDVEHDGQEGLFAALDEAYELIVLDRMLPRFSGDAICRRLRVDGSTVPVLLLTARDTPRDVAEGLDAGADDYLGKPFAFEELTARVRALLRRAAGVASPRFQAGALELDPAAHRAWWDGREVALTAKEYQLLEALVRRRGRVLSKTQLARAAWDAEPEDNVIEVHLSHLRRKLAPDCIRTVRGVGYAWNER